MTKIDPHSMLEDCIRNPHKIGWLAGKTLLTDMHSKWCWEVWGAPEGIHTSLQAHRGGYKTTAVTEVGIIWWLLTHPDDSVMLIRETWTEACKTLKAIEKYMEVPEIAALFKIQMGEAPKFVVKKTGQLTFSFKRSITKEGSIDAYGGDSVPTGSHYSAILVDDLITYNDRISKAKRERSKDVIREIITNIVNRGRSVHFVGTPWHKDDGWQLCPKPTRYDCYQTGLISEAELAGIKGLTTASLFAANYELNHLSDEGAIFTDPMFAEWDHTVPYVWVASHLDAKFSGDHTNALTIASKRKDGKIQVYGKVFKEHVDIVMPRIKQIMLNYRSTRVHNEINPDKGYVSKQLASNDPTNLKIKPARVCSYQEKMDKHIKIVSYGRHYWDRLLFDNNTDPEYLNQILDYREGEEPDDAPDSLSSILRQEFFPNDPSNRGNRILWEL
jgi:hypothetical protein